MHNLKKNIWFLICFIPIWITAFIFRLTIEKGDFLLKISESRNELLNVFFSLSTRLGEEISYVSLAIIFLFIRLRNSLAIAICGISVTVIAEVTKSIFREERPFSYFQRIGQGKMYKTIDGIEPYLGLTSFPSGHTMGAFALAFLLCYYTNKIGLKILLVFLACLTGFSRIYLGHHFLEDVLLGSVLGIIIGAIVYSFSEKLKAASLNNAINIIKKDNARS